MRARTSADDPWLVESVTAVWGSLEIASRGRLHRADRLPGLVAERAGFQVGLLTYHIDAQQLEVVTIQATDRRTGVGGALLEAARETALERCCRRLWVVTTNDNVDAIRFYEHMGMRRVAVHRGAVAESRRLKPSIPLCGAGGVALEDEWEFEWAFEAVR